MTSPFTRATSQTREALLELRRQRSVAYYGLAGTRAWRVVDANLARLAVSAQKRVCADFLAIDILDRDRQWSIGGTRGEATSVSARCFSLCAVVLNRVRRPAQLFVIDDASKDPELAENVWVNGDASAIRFYAAAPLLGRERLPLGIVSMWSERPFQATADQLNVLRGARDAAGAFLEARRNERERIHAWTARRHAGDL
jgi:GAF domain-containing protein